MLPFDRTAEQPHAFFCRAANNISLSKTGYLQTQSSGVPAATLGPIQNNDRTTNWAREVPSLPGCQY
jgi:hypothetical protein